MHHSLYGSQGIQIGEMSIMAWGSEFFIPKVWIDGDHMFATCAYLTGRTYSDTTINSRMTFENRLWRELRDNWGVYAQTLRLTYQKSRVEILFNNPEEFVLAKLGGRRVK
jgi:hypothetical protein